MSCHDFVSIHVESHVSIVKVRGEIDPSTAPELRQALERLRGDVIVDLSEVEFMDSSALNLLVAANKRAASSQWKLVLRGVQPNSLRLLEISGLDEVFVLDDGSLEADVA